MYTDALLYVATNKSNNGKFLLISPNLPKIRPYFSIAQSQRSCFQNPSGNQYRSLSEILR